QAAGEQGLAGAGGAGEQQVVPPGGGHLQGAAGLVLADHVRHVEVMLHRAVRHPARLDVEGRRPPQVGAHLQQVAGGEDGGVVGEGRLVPVAVGDHQLAAGATAGDGGGQQAVHRPQFAVEGELGDELVVAEVLRRQLSRGGENAEGDGQVVAAALLGNIGGGEVDGDAPGREVEVGVEQGAAHPLPALLHRRLRHAYDAQARQAVGQVDLDG